MAIKGGLLDCKGQLENEENFNRIQERYGYEEEEEVPVVRKNGKEWGDTFTIGASYVGRNYIMLSYTDDDFHIYDLPTECTVYINDEAFPTQYVRNPSFGGDMGYELGGDYVGISESITESGASLIFASPITEDMVGNTYTFSATKPGTVTYPMDSKYLPAAEAVADAAGDTVTGEEFNALLASLCNAGYLSK